MNSANDKPRKALGKGLSALLPGRGQPVATAARHSPGSCCCHGAHRGEAWNAASRPDPTQSHAATDVL